MPNGSPDWNVKERPELEQFFGRIGGVLKGFAKCRNLAIEKYYHQFPSWDFRFRHPKGGLGQIEVHRANERQVEILGTWWVDDYGTCTRWHKGTGKRLCDAQSPELVRLLEEIFAEIVSWGREILIPWDQRYEEWKELSQDEFEREQRRYPLPKVD